MGLVGARLAAPDLGAITTPNVGANFALMTIGTTYFAGAGASRTFYPTMPLASEMTLGCFLTVVV